MTTAGTTSKTPLLFCYLAENMLGTWDELLKTHFGPGQCSKAVCSQQLQHQDMQAEVVP